MKAPQFIRFINPIIACIKDLGGSGNASEVSDLVIDLMNISEDELEVKLKSGASRIKNQVAWARIYLVKSDYLDSSQRGVWSLTEKGLKTESLSEKEVYALYKRVQLELTGKRADKSVNSRNSNVPEIIFTESDETPLFAEAHTERLLSILQSLPPHGFERLCQRLLRESGFKKVVVTGKSGDGGIDGEGILEINPLMSFKVLFQAKRYVGAVSSSQVRDFRGAMQGRADKGIIITTGRFTRDAKAEAMRDGAPPIELVDGEQLVNLFESKGLGLNPVTIYEIDEPFFDEYR